MCGIAGFLLDEINPAAPDWLTAMTQSLFHRGPDDGGGVIFGMNGKPTVARRFAQREDRPNWSYIPAKIGMGARRLSIVDRSDAGAQPMSSPDGRVWLVYNGEIYNHAVLRSELSDAGATFHGHSDTEVLFNGYRAWGAEIFARLDGMFAAAIVDWAAGKMFLARDYFGIKPLYLGRFEGGMGFASEIKALLMLPGQPAGINETVLRDFLCDGRIDVSDETMFTDIWAMPAGSYLELDLRGKGAMHAGATLHYLEWPFDANADAKGEQRLRDMLQTSVRSHLQGEVPIGSCLSGGIDSSSVVSLAHALKTSGAFDQLSQHTFTAVLPGDALDESQYAQAVIDACDGLESHRIEPTPERFIACVDDLLWHQEQPFGSPSIYMQWEVMRLARARGVTVLLDGQGGDELFCGYEGYIPMFLADLLRRGKIGRFRREYKCARQCHYRDRKLLKHVLAALLPAATREKWRRADWLTKRPWLDPELFIAEVAPTMWDRLGIRAANGRSEPASAFAGRWWSMLRRDSLPQLLRFEDRNSMAHSIEARVPFLTRAVLMESVSGTVGDHAQGAPVDALPISADDKIVDGQLKASLRAAMRGVVPDAVLNRRDKIGFSAPTGNWMRGGLEPWWKELVTSQSFLDRGCFLPKGVVKLIDRTKAGDDEAALHLWRVAMVEQWARRFLDG